MLWLLFRGVVQRVSVPIDDDGGILRKLQLVPGQVMMTIGVGGGGVGSVDVDDGGGSRVIVVLSQ